MGVANKKGFSERNGMTRVRLGCQRGVGDGKWRGADGDGSGVCFEGDAGVVRNGVQDQVLGTPPIQRRPVRGV